MLTELECLAAEFFAPTPTPLASSPRLAEARAAWMRARGVVMRHAMRAQGEWSRVSGSRGVLDLREATIRWDRPCR